MIGWWSHSQDLRVASVRIRGELVIRELQQLGMAVEWFNSHKKNEYKTLVLGKRYDSQTLDVVRQLKMRKCRVIVDLCDNRFVFPAKADQLRQQAEQLRAVLAEADHLVVSTEALADAAKQHCESLPPISVIGDPADRLEVIKSPITSRLLDTVRAGSFLRQINSLRRQGHTLLVWFGSHGGPYAESGMTDLLKIKSILEALHPQFPIALSVISNNKEKYSELIKNWRIPNQYIDWSPVTFNELLKAHDISVIPINGNEFTRCKTDNRVVTSLLNGIAVVADSIPSYEPYKHSIQLGDWQHSLHEYLTSPAKRQHDVTTGTQLVKHLTDARTLALKWQKILQ